MCIWNSAGALRHGSSLELALHGHPAVARCDLVLRNTLQAGVFRYWMVGYDQGHGFALQYSV